MQRTVIITIKKNIARFKLFIVSSSGSKTVFVSVVRICFVTAYGFKRKPFSRITAVFGAVLKIVSADILILDR